MSLQLNINYNPFFYKCLQLSSVSLNHFQAVHGESNIVRFLARCLEETSPVSTYEKLSPGNDLKSILEIKSLTKIKVFKCWEVGEKIQNSEIA